MPQLADVEVDFVSLVDKAAVRDPQNPTEPRRFVLFKREGTSHKEGSTMSGETDALRAELEKAEREKVEAEQRAVSAETAKAAAEQELAKLKVAPQKDANEDEQDGDESSDMEKSELPPAVRAELEKREEAAAARVAKAEERAAEAVTLAKAERDQRLEREFIAKAEELKALPVKASEFGPLLKRASESLSADDCAALDALLSAADQQLVTSDLFKQVGSSVGGSSEPDVYQEIKRRATELRKSDSKLTQEAAEVEVVKGDRVLQARVLAEEGS